MSTEVLPINIDGCFLIKIKKHGDSRGYFIESYRREWIPGSREMIQMNCSRKQQGSLAGFHYHLHQADYWYVPMGVALVNLYDLRVGSPTEGNLYSCELSGNSGIYIAPGVAHGFSAKEDLILTYLVDNYYNEKDELGVAWNDKHIGAEWGFDDPILSTRDSLNPQLADIPEINMPRWPLRT